MRTFLQLLPFRIEQALGAIAIRPLRAQYFRKKFAHDIKSPANSRRILFIDVAVISKHNAGTGIQRVVSAIATALLDKKQELWDIRFVSARRKRRYFEIDFPSPTHEQLVGAEMNASPGDVFLGLDYALDTVRQHRSQLRRFRQSGGSVWFLVHDLLPLNHPEWFSQNTVIRYNAWLGVLAGVADGFFCNSEQTETELRQALADHFGVGEGYVTQVLPMGYDIAPAAKERLEERARADRVDFSKPFALMVGTVEPRKGHDDIISAFEELWKQGYDERLVIVGRRGWHVERLERRIATHPELEKRLVWLTDVNDQELVTLYDASNGVIIGSYAEGFGLPVIEALGRNKPVLARDLPVFRMHENAGVWFFPADATPTVLARHIRKWHAAACEGKIRVRLPAKGWVEAADIIIDTLNAWEPGMIRKDIPDPDVLNDICAS